MTINWNEVQHPSTTEALAYAQDFYTNYYNPLNPLDGWHRYDYSEHIEVLVTWGYQGDFFVQSRIKSILLFPLPSDLTNELCMRGWIFWRNPITGVWHTIVQSQETSVHHWQEAHSHIKQEATDMALKRARIDDYYPATHTADITIYPLPGEEMEGVPLAPEIGPELAALLPDCALAIFYDTDPPSPYITSLLNGPPAPWVTSTLIQDGEVAAGDLADPLQPAGNIKHDQGKDTYSDSEATMSLFRRLSNGLIIPTDHFRSGNIPAGFAWAGAPFSTPPTIDYSLYDTYLKTIHASGARAFLYQSVTNWQNALFTIRAFCLHAAAVGIRIDDGSDDNYVQAYLDATVGGYGYQTMRVQHRTGAGAITTIDTFISPRGTPHTFRARVYSPSPPTWTPYFYLLTEASQMAVITATPPNTWTPARVGILIHEGVTGAAEEIVDWFATTFS